MPPLSFTLGACVVLAVWFGAGTALQPVKSKAPPQSQQNLVQVETWTMTRRPDRPPVPSSVSAPLQDLSEDPRISPGSVWKMIEYMHRSEIEIATQRLDLEHGEWNIAPAFRPEAGALPVDLRSRR